jgi:hypothetical protein
MGDGSKDNSVQWLGSNMENMGSVPCRGRDIFLCCLIQISSDPHLASYPVGTRASFPWAEWPGHEAGLVMSRLRMWGAVTPLHHVFIMWCITEPSNNYAFIFMCRGQCCRLQASLSWLTWRDISKENVAWGLSLDLNSMRNIWEVHPLHTCVLRESGHRRQSSLPHRSSCAAGIHLVTFLLLLLTRISHWLIVLTV